MPDVKFERDTQRMECFGLDLNRPVDSVKPNKYPYLLNVRAYLAGRIEPRDGLTITGTGPVVAGQTPEHSVRRLNDPANNTWTRICGTGTHLAYGQGPYTDLDTGYSGNPLALTPYRPLGSPSSFMYVADSDRMRKVNAQGGLHTIGFAAPAIAPGVMLTSPPYYKDVATFQATTGWSAGGTAGAPSALGYRTSTTISKILYDSGTTGWASINPAIYTNIGPGERIIVNPGGGTEETQTVQATFPASVATTIASIIYDSGTSGRCSIVLTTPVTQAASDAMIYDSTATETARIIAVVTGPSNTTSVRLVTAGTWAVGDTIQVLQSFRIYLTHTHAAGETLQEDAVTTQVTVGIGTLTKTSTLDLSNIATGIPATPDDYMHISFLVDNPANLNELRVLLDVDSTTNNFTQNYYFTAFRPSDLTPATSSLQTLLATRTQLLQNQVTDQNAASNSTAIANANDASLGTGTPLDNGGLSNQELAAQAQAQAASDQQSIDAQNAAISTQIDAGETVWVELLFPISQLIRVGTDLSRTLANVAALQILINASATVNVYVDSWWIGGGYGPDTTSPTAVPYLYRFCARNPATNVSSNFSPASRYSANPIRQSVTVTPAQYAAPSGTTLTAADFVLDIERFGGQNASWNYVGTIPNAASPTFADIYDDLLVGGNPQLTNNNYQPWPIIGLPVSGTTGIVSGTSVKDSGANFNTSWAPGTQIIIANQPYVIYRVISTSLLELATNAGAQSGVAWQIPAPMILAQPLPCLWYSAEQNVFFGCGDPINPGRLYWSNPGSETCTPANYLDVTSPSEQLMNGLSYNVRDYLFSSENFFQVLSSASLEALSQNSSLASAPVGFIAEKIPNGKGLFSRWALTREPAPIIAFLARDGINMTTGGAPLPLTDADMYELFPNEANLGTEVNGIPPPNIIAANAAQLRLAYYDEYLYFDYLQVGGGDDGGMATLVLAFDLGAAVRGEAPGGWFWDNYTPNIVMHYGEEGASVHALLCGGTDGALYQYTGDSDAGTPITCAITTPSRDQDQPRINKLYGDIMLDANTAGVNVTATPFFNNNSTSTTPVTVNTATRAQTAIPLGTVANTPSNWQTALNVSLFLSFTVSTAARPFFYIWEPRWTFEAAPLASVSWEISPTTFGMENFKHVGICKVTHVSTVDLLLTFTIDGVAQPGIAIANSAGQYMQTIFRVPVTKAKLYKLRIASSDGATTFRLDTRDSFFEVKDWAEDGEYQKLRIFGDFSVVEG